MQAMLIERVSSRYKWGLRLWTGEVLTLRRSDIPIHGPLKVGDVLDVVVVPKLRLVDAKRISKDFS
jgi:hypothetical protein